MNEGNGFKVFVERTETTRQYNKGVGIFGEQCFADEEIADGHPFVHIGIGFLFVRKLDIATHTPATGFPGAAVGSLHDTWSATRHDRKPQLGDAGGELAGEFIIGMPFFETGRSKNGYTGPHEVKSPETLDKFIQYGNGKLKFFPAALRTFEEADLCFRHS